MEQQTVTVEENNQKTAEEVGPYQLRTGQKIYLVFKRLIDIVGAFVGIIVCSVLIWWWATIINAIVTKGHPFFNRHRVGRNGKAFICLKLRSMKADTDPHLSSTGSNVSSHITGFGKFLRVSSIDETPQLLNILVGQMSFIGPRPLIDVNDEDVLTVNKRKENGSIQLRPGLSGYAQIHHRSDLDPIEKADYDFIYLKRMSFWFDTKIFVYTILKVLGAVKGR